MSVHHIPFTLDGKPTNGGQVAVLWEEMLDGDHVALLDVPDGGYVLVTTESPFTGRDSVDFYDIFGGQSWIGLPRPSATRLAAVLTSTLLLRSNDLIDWFIEHRLSKAVTA